MIDDKTLLFQKISTILPELDIHQTTIAADYDPQAGMWTIDIQLPEQLLRLHLEASDFKRCAPAAEIRVPARNKTFVYENPQAYIDLPAKGELYHETNPGH